ncbi:hypothetical protein EC991_000949, partial [Linnemannia zychae]
MYCDEVHGGDCIVNASRMLGFFESVVFKRKVKKYINPNAGFSGVVRVAAVKGKGQATRQQQRRPGEWRPMESQEDTSSSTLEDIELCAQMESARVAKNVRVENEEDVGDEQGQGTDKTHGSSERPDSDDEFEREDRMHRPSSDDQGVQIVEDSEGALMINSVAEKNK